MIILGTDWFKGRGQYHRKDGILIESVDTPNNRSEWRCVAGPSVTKGLRWTNATQAMEWIDRKVPLGRESEISRAEPHVTATEILESFNRVASSYVDPPDSYTDDNPKTAYGDKKPSLHLVPPALTLAAAGVFKLGARKYGPYNWREKTVSSSVYQGAAMRHLLAWWDGEDIDPESGESHLAHAAACIGILLDAEAIGKLNDNRPPKGAAAEIIREKEDKS